MAGFFKKILSKFSKDKIDWDDLEESLITGDLGVKLSMQIIDNLQDKKNQLTPMILFLHAKKKSERYYHLTVIRFHLKQIKQKLF